MSKRPIQTLLRWGLPALLGFNLLPPPSTVDTATPTGWPVAVSGGTATGSARLAEATAVVRAAMAAAGSPYRGWAAAGRTFVAFDPRGDGRAVEIIGALDTATHVVILVPGVGTQLVDFDRGLGGVGHRSLSRQARAVHAMAHEIDPQARLAVVAWLGYDPPDGLGIDVAGSASATRGARELAAFVAGLAAIRPEAAVTVVAHSYGAVVAGQAAARLPRMTDLVVLGAPGMGVRHADDLGTPARIWAGQAERDWIRWVPGVRVFGLGHGRHPADPAFGARALPTAGVGGHDGYLVPGSPTLRAVALIGLGRHAEVRR